MRPYMAAALLLAGNGGSGGSGASGGTHSGGGRGASTAPGGGGGSFSGGPENDSRTTRNGRGVSTATTPTKWTEDAQEGQRKGRGGCANCCDACSGNLPVSFTVTIPGAAGAVVLSRVNTGLGSGVCRWEWNGRQTSGCAAYPWMEKVVLLATTFQFQLSVQDADSNTLFNWFITTSMPRDCMAALTGWGGYTGAVCSNPGAPTVTPGDQSKCCPCTVCCDHCGGDYSPHAWRVTIDGYTFLVNRNTLLDSEAVGNEYCVYRRAINVELCGLLATAIEVRIKHTAVYLIEVELYESDGSSHTLWNKSGGMTPLDCDTAHVLTVSSGECGDSITATPVGPQFCLPEGSGGTGVGECGCCQLDDDTNEYDMDFGAAGFLEDALAYDTLGEDCDVTICDSCDTVGGVYTVTRSTSILNSCVWRYTEQICGDRPSFRIFRSNGSPITCTDDSTTLTVSLQRVVTGDKCYWKAVATVSYGCTSSSEMPSGELYAEWRSTPTDPETACNLASPLTLTKHSENDEWSQCGAMIANPPTACMGAWPATITIQSA